MASDPDPRPRGGPQYIPRPPGVRAGLGGRWHDLGPPDARFTLAEVRAALAGSAPPVPSAWAGPDARPTAVLIPVFEAGGEVHLILTKRPETMRSHRGEIAFPGGKFEPGTDASLAATACREAAEEIGLDPHGVRVLGELDAIATFVSGFTISPFVGELPGRPALTLQTEEVEAAFEVPVSELFSEATHRTEIWDIPGSRYLPEMRDREMFFFDLPGETVWGATGRILASFLDVLAAFRREQR